MDDDEMIIEEGDCEFSPFDNAWGSYSETTWKTQFNIKERGILSVTLKPLLGSELFPELDNFFFDKPVVISEMLPETYLFNLLRSLVECKVGVGGFMKDVFRLHNKSGVLK